MRILVTGATGFVGGRLVSRLVERWCLRCLPTSLSSHTCLCSIHSRRRHRTTSSGCLFHPAHPVGCLLSDRCRLVGLCRSALALGTVPVRRRDTVSARPCRPRNLRIWSRPVGLRSVLAGPASASGRCRWPRHRSNCCNRSLCTTFEKRPRYD